MAPILTHALRAQHSLLVAELRQGSRPSRLRIRFPYGRAAAYRVSQEAVTSAR